MNASFASNFHIAIQYLYYACTLLMTYRKCAVVHWIRFFPSLSPSLTFDATWACAGHRNKRTDKLKFKSRRVRKVNFPDHRKQFIVNWDHFVFIYHLAIDKHIYMHIRTGAKQNTKCLCGWWLWVCMNSFFLLCYSQQIDFDEIKKNGMGLFIGFNSSI